MVFYVDVYFLINFTVNILALYFTAVITKTKSSIPRLTVIGAVGAVLATAEVLLENGIALEVLFMLLLGVFTAAILPRRAYLSRRIKCSVMFFALEMLIGGAVSFFYSVLDKHLYAKLSNTVQDSPNRRLLVLSLLVLLAIGIIKLLTLLFSHTATTESKEIKISAFGKEITLEGLVDTGNLLSDPMTKRPVIIIKRNTLLKLIPDLPSGTEDAALLSERLSGRVRVIPSGSGLLIGIKPDEITVIEGAGKECTVDAILACDKEGGTFGGYPALLPAVIC